MEDFVILYFEVLGKKENSCVIYFKVKELKQTPPGLDPISEIALKSLLKDSPMECLVPKEYYQKGSKEAIDYALENIQNVCKGGLIDLLDKVEN